MILIVVGAIMQSALFPFHKWLLSSLNSPTPVSSMMHAGIVNGGGYLLIKLAPLYNHDVLILNVIFMAGFTSAFIGTIWKLIQNNNKNMLACSTLAQMGCMIMEIGMGFFSVALAHITLHSMFKSYLFLASGSAANEKRIAFNKVSYREFIISLFIGFVCILLFSKITNVSFYYFDTRFIILFLCYMSFVQFALTLWDNKLSLNFSLMLLYALIPAFIYGFNISFIHNIFATNFDSAQSLNILHIIALTIFILSWFALSVLKLNIQNKYFIQIRNYLYIQTLNSSSPDMDTITTNRNNYSY
jgi:NAD(P)H-quinone oxidoreductase subunit 5